MKKNFVTFCKAIKQNFQRIFRKMKNPNDCDTIIVYRYQLWEKSGGDILPGPIEVPTSDTLYYGLYETEKGLYITTKITTKFFFIIPFTYDEYIVRVTRYRYDVRPYDFNTITAEIAVQEIDEAEHWNQRSNRKYIRDYSELWFAAESGVGIEHFDIGDNDYSYLKYYNIN